MSGTSSSWNSGSQCSMPGKLRPALDRLEQRVVGDGAELLQEAGAETLDRGGVEQTSLTGRSSSSFDLALRALAQRVEGPDRLRPWCRTSRGAAAERGAAREEVDQAAADRVFAGLHDRADAAVAVALEVGEELGRGRSGRLARTRWWRGSTVSGAGTFCRTALAEVRTRRGSSPRPAASRAERGQPLGHDLGVGRDAVVGQAVPGREWTISTSARRSAPRCASNAIRGRSRATCRIVCAAPRA